MSRTYKDTPTQYVSNVNELQRRQLRNKHQYDKAFNRYRKTKQNRKTQKKFDFEFEVSAYDLSLANASLDVLLKELRDETL